MRHSYGLKYRHPRTGAVALVILPAKSDVADEKVRLESLGCIVTEVVRSIGARPESPHISRGKKSTSGAPPIT